MKVQCEYCDSYIEVDESYVCPCCGAPLGAAVHAAEEKARLEAEEAAAREKAELEAARQKAYAQQQAQRTADTINRLVEGVVLGSMAAQQSRQRTVYVQRPAQPQRTVIVKPAQPHRPARPTQAQPQRPASGGLGFTKPGTPSGLGQSRPSSGPSRPGAPSGPRTRRDDNKGGGPKGRR